MRERPLDESTGGEGGTSERAGPSRRPPPPADSPGGGDDDDAAPGWFPSWGALYATVIVYTAALIFLLWVFSVTLDHSVP